MHHKVHNSTSVVDNRILIHDLAMAVNPVSPAVNRAEQSAIQCLARRKAVKDICVVLGAC